RQGAIGRARCPGPAPSGFRRGSADKSFENERRAVSNPGSGRGLNSIETPPAPLRRRTIMKRSLIYPITALLLLEGAGAAFAGQTVHATAHGKTVIHK